MLFFLSMAPRPPRSALLSLHDALPISESAGGISRFPRPPMSAFGPMRTDRKSTRLNSSHRCISYAVFCLKRKNASACESSFASTDGRFDVLRVAEVAARDIHDYNLSCV